MPHTGRYNLLFVAFGAYALRPTPTRRRTRLAARLAATQTETQTEDAAELLRQAATLRAEAAQLERELKPVTVAEGANNVLPLPRPAWKTQVWFDEDRPLRFSWRLLAGARRGRRRSASPPRARSRRRRGAGRVDAAGAVASTPRNDRVTKRSRRGRPGVRQNS